MSQRIIRTGQSRQQGATLVVALLVLVLIMMIGIAAINTSTTQFTVAGNLQFEDSAMNNAESALTTGETWLRSNYKDAGFTTRVSGPLYPLPASGTLPVDPLTLDWTTDTASTKVASNPSQRYFIQLISQNSSLPGSSQAMGGRTNTVCNKVNTYLVAARGASARGATKIVQSYFSVQSCS
jgi:Tfp pilus assembly protein PilX